MKFCLNTSIVKDNDEDVVNNAVILLHGYGADGNDISLSLIHISEPTTPERIS